MSRRFINCRPTFICLCLHQKREHWHTKENPQGPVPTAAAAGTPPKRCAAVGMARRRTRRASAKSSTCADVPRSERKQHERSTEVTRHVERRVLLFRGRLEYGAEVETKPAFNERRTSDASNSIAGALESLGMRRRSLRRTANEHLRYALDSQVPCSRGSLLGLRVGDRDRARCPWPYRDADARARLRSV